MCAVAIEVRRAALTKDKDYFWELKSKAADVGISAGLMGKLLAVVDDYVLAREYLEYAISRQRPVPWLGALIRDWSASPEIVRRARLNHMPVSRYVLKDGTTGWKVGSTIYNKDGVDVGG